MPDVLGYALLFLGISVAFIFVHLMIGRLVRPFRPDAEKKTIYECGEPTVGSAWVQFDLRFYVVALLFVIFDVEVAFFFPWAVVFGKANQLSDPALPAQRRLVLNEELGPREAWRSSSVDKQVPGQNPPRYEKFKSALLDPDAQAAPEDERVTTARMNRDLVERNRSAAETFAWFAFADVLVFFGVLLVGFAYLWRRGDLDWVRSTAAQKEEEEELAAV